MQALPDAEDRYEKTNEECRDLFLKLNRLDVVALYIDGQRSLHGLHGNDHVALTVPSR
jgi:hypothetical protein